MSRHTLEDGKTDDERIRSDAFDLWWPELAPPPRLVGAYYRGLPWTTFEAAYLDHLAFVARHVVQDLAALSRVATVTLLCIEPTDEHCHRRILREYVASLGGHVT